MREWIMPFLAAILILSCTACGAREKSSQSAPLSVPSVSSQTEPSPEASLPAVSNTTAPPPEEPLSPGRTSTPEDSPPSQSSPPAFPEEEAVVPVDRPQTEPPHVLPAAVDLDLTGLSSTLVYAEVFNMMSAPNDCIGKTIRIKGIFSIYQEPETQTIYCGVIVQDATACCAQGFDLVMPDDSRYPDDYPPAQSEVTVVGTIQADHTLEDDGILLLHLENIHFE